MAIIDGFEIRRDGTTITDVGLVHSATVSGLTANTSYDFEIRSYGDGHVSEWSSVVTESTLSPFSPSSLSGLVEWLKADAIIGLADNDPISTWTASAGNNGTAAGTVRPTYQTNELNGLPIVRFDGVNDLLSVGNFSALSAGEIFIVVKIPTDPPATGKSLWAFGTPSDNYYPYSNGIIYDDWGSTVRKTTVDPTPSLASWRVYNVFSAANDWGSNLDGASLHTTATNTVGFLSTCYIGQTAGQYLACDIAELVMYNRKLTAPERAQVLGYLQDKYAL